MTTPGEERDVEDFGLLPRALGASRYFILIPVVGSFVAAVVLTIFGALAVCNVALLTWEQIRRREFTSHAVEHTAVEFIQLIDIFLLGAVLYIVALGLYELFIDPALPLPPWLKITDLDELKEKLIGVVVVLLGVGFLGEVITWQNDPAILALGVAVATVIAALSLVFALMPKRHLEHRQAEAEARPLDEP
ncbi:MAG TPA: YqhA family protein [Thermomicrobiales bacterium]|nr:YqhA family protein [Thermomicrobiales bacterium]